ncbi:MAG: hypothetical protein HZB26_03245 [Candidatus Hydrogenedentes bacterium]|nr:hypothetical protein [Candidatus Hydrogenedentota bacterium]
MEALRLVLTNENPKGRQDSEPCEETAELVDPAFTEAHVRQMKLKLARYFDALKKEFPYTQLGQILTCCNCVCPDSSHSEFRRSESTEAQIRREVDQLVTQWLENFNAFLTRTLVGVLTAAAIAGFTEVFVAWTKRCRLNASPDRYTRRFRDWASVYVDQLVASMNEAIRNTINTVVENGLRNKDSAKDILEDVRNHLDEEQLTDDGRLMLAANEARTAANHGMLEAGIALGATFKRWRTRPNRYRCKVCLANEAQGKIPINEKFASGHTMPRAHPNCRCYLDFPAPSCKRIATALDESA